jgi:hypothetical protein
VLAAKRAFPRAFGEAERSLGKRLSEASDEILVAYLENFMGSSVLAEEPEGASELRQALGEIGVLIPNGVDLREWAEAVRKHAPALIQDMSPIVRSGPAVSTGKQAPAQPDKPRALANRDLLAERTIEPAGDLDLDDLFEPTQTASGTGDVPKLPEKPAETTTPPVETLVDVEDDLGDEVSSTTGGEHPFEAEDELGGFSGDDIFGGLGDGFSDEQPIPVGNDSSEVAAVESFFDDTSILEPNSNADVDATATAEAAGEPEPTVTHQGQATGGGDTDTAGAASHGAEPEKDALNRTEPTKGEGVEPREPLPAWQAGRTVKPQLFPPAPTGGRGAKRERRTIRSRALPADLPDVPIEVQPGVGTTELDEKVRNQLLASISVPRPVFTSDLASMVGSEEMVSAWREELQNGDLTVRFVLPKPRHKLRGSLVIPQANLAATNGEFARSHWARCMEAYRGARIYELGVFFHRFGEQVISFESDGEVVSVRMSLPSGLTGAVLVAGQDLAAGGATRSSLCGVLERLLQDRLVHIAVLVLNAEQFEAVANVLESEARTRGWKASMPVTLSRSWEYVDGTGTAVPLLGV